MKVKEGEIREAKKSERNREMGRCLGTLTYFISFNDLPFKFYESTLPWFTLNDIDMGEVNHSKRFIHDFVKSVFQVLQVVLKIFLKNRYLARAIHRPLLYSWTKVLSNLM